MDVALAEQQEGGGGMEEIQTGSLGWKGMPTGGGRVLFPTMWCLVVDRLLRLFSEAGFFTRSYEDDVIIAIIADEQGIASGLMRSALSIVEKWCGKVQLTVNPEKAKAVFFTRKYKIRPVSGLELLQEEIKVSKEP